MVHCRPQIIYLFTCKCFLESFENTQNNKVKILIKAAITLTNVKLHCSCNFTSSGTATAAACSDSVAQLPSDLWSEAEKMPCVTGVQWMAFEQNPSWPVCRAPPRKNSQQTTWFPRAAGESWSILRSQSKRNNLVMTVRRVLVKPTVREWIYMQGSMRHYNMLMF